MPTPATTQELENSLPRSSENNLEAPSPSEAQGASIQNQRPIDVVYCRPGSRPTSAGFRIVNACEQGWLDEVRSYQASWDWQAVDKPCFDPNNQGSIELMLLAAIALKQRAVVEHLLQKALILPGLIFTQETAFRNPDLEIFKILHACDSEIIDCELSYGIVSPLSLACCSADPTIPLYMLGQNVNSNIGRLGSPLSNALRYHQPLETIKMLIEKGARVDDYPLREAIRWERIDALELFLKRGFYKRSCVDFKEEAYNTKNPRVIALVEGPERRWWQFWRAGGNVIALVESPERRWWQFWRAGGNSKGTGDAASLYESKLDDDDSL